MVVGFWMVDMGLEELGGVGLLARKVGFCGDRRCVG